MTKTTMAGIVMMLATTPGSSIVSTPDPGMVCIGCTVITALSMEGAFEEVQGALSAKCHAGAECVLFLEALDKVRLDEDVTPDTHCKNQGLCSNLTCSLFNATISPDYGWPLESLPPSPPAWPTQDIKPATEPASTSSVEDHSSLSEVAHRAHSPTV